MDMGLWQQFGMMLSEASNTAEATEKDPFSLVVDWMGKKQIEEVKQLLTNALGSLDDKELDTYWGESMADFGASNTRLFFTQLLDGINAVKR